MNSKYTISYTISSRCGYMRWISDAYFDSGLTIIREPQFSNLRYFPVWYLAFWLIVK